MHISGLKSLECSIFSVLCHKFFTSVSGFGLMKYSCVGGSNEMSLM